MEVLFSKRLIIFKIQMGNLCPYRPYNGVERGKVWASNERPMSPLLSPGQADTLAAFRESGMHFAVMAPRAECPPRPLTPHEWLCSHPSTSSSLSARPHRHAETTAGCHRGSHCRHPLCQRALLGPHYGSGRMNACLHSLSILLVEMHAERGDGLRGVLLFIYGSKILLKDWMFLKSGKFFPKSYRDWAVGVGRWVGTGVGICIDYNCLKFVKCWYKNTLGD